MKNIFFILFLFFGFSASAKVVMTLDKALETSFPNMKVEKKRVYLSKDSILLLEKQARSRFNSQVFSYYEVSNGSGREATAFILTHKLRTRTQTLFIIFDNKGILKSTEVLAFYEPDEYIMDKKWFSLFEGNSIANNLSMKSNKMQVAGSTISYNETSKAIRRISTLYSFIYD